MGFWEALVSKLPVGVQPYAKALVPVVLAVVAVVEQLVETGEFTGDALYAAVGGFVVAVLTYAVPNRNV